MIAAQQISLVFGVLVLFYGLFLGVPTGQERATARQANEHLVNTHLSSLMMGSMHMGLTYAIGFAAGSTTLLAIAAILSVVGSGFITIGGSLNWIMKADDQFAEKSPGYMFNAAGGPPSLIGAGIITVAVIVGL